jgi:hypothetical protein
VRTTHFWNNLYRVGSNQNKFKRIWEQKTQNLLEESNIFYVKIYNNEQNYTKSFFLQNLQTIVQHLS